MVTVVTIQNIRDNLPSFTLPSYFKEYFCHHCVVGLILDTDLSHILIHSINAGRTLLARSSAQMFWEKSTLKVSQMTLLCVHSKCHRHSEIELGTPAIIRLVRSLRERVGIDQQVED